MSIVHTVVSALVVAAAVPAGAAARDTGFLNRAVSVDATVYRYQIYVPRERPPAASTPVILALHGGGEYGTDGLSQTDGGLAHAIRQHPERFPAIVVFPQSPPGGTPGFQGLGERIALAALDSAISEFGGARARIYLTGYSMGGNGAWYLAYHHPDRFAAVIVVCGFVEAFVGTTSGVRYPPIAPPTAADPYAEIARRVGHIPIWIFHGDADRTVPVEQSRRMAAALQAEGADVHYTELPGVPHNAWDPAYGRPELFAWLFGHKR